MFTINKFLTKFYTNSFFLQLNVISQFLANTSHKLIIAFRPLQYHIIFQPQNSFGNLGFKYLHNKYLKCRNKIKNSQSRCATPANVPKLGIFIVA